MAFRESRFETNAVSSRGAQGIMQLMPKTARALGVQNSFDPQQNIPSWWRKSDRVRRRKAIDYVAAIKGFYETASRAL